MTGSAHHQIHKKPDLDGENGLICPAVLIKGWGNTIRRWTCLQLGSGGLAFSSSGVAVGSLLHLALVAPVTTTWVPANTEIKGIATEPPVKSQGNRTTLNPYLAASRFREILHRKTPHPS